MSGACIQNNVSRDQSCSSITHLELLITGVNICCLCGLRFSEESAMDVGVFCVPSVFLVHTDPDFQLTGNGYPPCPVTFDFCVHVYFLDQKHYEWSDHRIVHRIISFSSCFTIPLKICPRSRNRFSFSLLIGFGCIVCCCCCCCCLRYCSSYCYYLYCDCCPPFLKVEGL